MWCDLLHQRERGLRKRSYLDAQIWRSDAFLSRLTLRDKLLRHDGCVNTISWNSGGTLLVSGSDDCHICVWDCWDSSSARHARCLATVPTGHVGNIFCAKFVPGSNDGQVVTCALDGAVRLCHVDYGSRAEVSRLLGRSQQFASKLEFLPDQPKALLTAGHDGIVSLYDTRVRPVSGESATTVVDLSAIGSCTTLAFDPVSCGGTNIFALGCMDTFVRTYDLRKSLSTSGQGTNAQPLRAFAPRKLIESPSRAQSSAYLSQGASGLAYSERGELLVNLRGADLFLFDARDGAPTKQTGPRHIDSIPTVTQTLGEYVGRINDETFAKECAFIHDGAFVATGGDCGHLYVWCKQSGELIMRERADGCIVNCVAPHPGLPVLAVSGIDSDIKLFSLGDARAGHGRLAAARHKATARAADAARMCEAVDDEDDVPWGRDEPRSRRMRWLERRAVLTTEEAAARLAAVQALREAGNVSFYAGAHSSAQEAYRDALSALRFNVPDRAARAEQSRSRLLCRLNLAASLLALQEWAEAENLCTRILKVDTTNVKALYRRAQARLELRRLADAQSDLAAALRLKQGDRSLHRLRERLALERQRERRATERRREAARALFCEADDGTQADELGRSTTRSVLASEGGAEDNNVGESDSSDALRNEIHDGEGNRFRDEDDDVRWSDSNGDQSD